MLIRRCKTGDRLAIALDATLDPARPVGELLAAGGIEIIITHIGAISVKLAIQAPAHFRIAGPPSTPDPDDPASGASGDRAAPV
ncbi:MAG: hypothetical protein ACYCXG_08045 [Acidiferrobacter sp.]